MVTEPLLPIGSTAVYRDVFRGEVWTQAPLRVLAADATSVRTALWPGVTTRAMKMFIESGDTDDKVVRLDSLDALARGGWDMAEWVWRRNSFVTETVSGRWFSIARVHGEDGAFGSWYVNFERPARWHASGWDTMDLALDLVVEPDGAWRWKDEDEYAQCRRLGLITDAEHVQVGRAREQAVALVEAREGLFGEDPAERWLPDPAWPLPALPGSR